MKGRLIATALGGVTVGMLLLHGVQIWQAAQRAERMHNLRMQVGIGGMPCCALDPKKQGESQLRHNEEAALTWMEGVMVGMNVARIARGGIEVALMQYEHARLELRMQCMREPRSAVANRVFDLYAERARRTSQ